MEKLEPKDLMGHLSSAVGHLIINAFSTIVSHSEILRASVGTTDRMSRESTERIEAIIQTALDASTMTRRLMDVGYDLMVAESADQENRPEEVHLDRLVAAFVDREREQGREATKFVLDLLPVPAIRGQAGQLRCMLELLIENAVEALPAGAGTITIATSIDDSGWIVLEIRDDGCGMGPAAIEHAVEPFFSTKPDHRGIGLTVARSIWRRHRGTLAIESKPQQGTVIRLSVSAPMN